MWTSAGRRGGDVLCKLGLRSGVGRWQSTSASSPVGEGRLEFQTLKYPTFWSRLKQQKQGLGNMALSASIAFLAISIIKQEREFERVTEVADRLKKQNDGLTEKLDGVRMVLVRAEEEDKLGNGGSVVARLREILDTSSVVTASMSSDEAENSDQRTPKSKFMI